MEEKNWLVLELEEGWKAVMPAVDIRPHSAITVEEAEQLKNIPETKLEVADLDCPCKPKLDYLNKMIVHNSFSDTNRINKAMEEPKTEALCKSSPHCSHNTNGRDLNKPCSIELPPLPTQ